MTNNTWGAIKLPLSYDVEDLAEEVAGIAENEWGVNGRIAPVFRNTQAIFLKGFAAAERNESIEDRAILKDLPCIRGMIYTLIPAAPQNCVLSYLPPGVNVGIHTDRGEYFDKTLRIHFPVTTNDKVSMYFGGRHKMVPGEVWLLNNSAPHGVENAHESKGRIHLICDYLPSPELEALISQSDKSLGTFSPDLLNKLRKKN